MAKAFGSTSPWAEPTWYSGRPSPYYNASHVKLRNWIRNWIDENVSGKSDEWEAAGKIPDEVYLKCAQDGLLVPIAAGNAIPHEWAGYPIAAGISPQEWNGFHDFILWDELHRGAPSISSVFVGLVVGAPPLKAYASKALQAEYWITNGMYSDYFMTLVRTGGPGAEGLSMLLIPRLPGMSTRKIEIGAGGLSATTYVTFEDVKVPASYLVGQEGNGFKYTMSNFNHERLFIAFQALRMARICLQDTMDWCKKREAFGKTLIEQPVVRHKFGHMARQVDGLQTWTESIVYELDNMTHEQGSVLLGGVTALLKVQGGIVGKHVADECQKLMGGLGLTKTGQGARVESVTRSMITLIVPGGSEDVLLDLGVREALKLSKIADKAKL